MSEVVVAFLIYALGQIFAKFVIEPLQDYYLVLSDIRHHLSTYVHSKGNVEDFYSKAIIEIEVMSKAIEETDGAPTEDSVYKKIVIDRYAERIKAEWKNADENSEKFKELAGQLISKSYLVYWVLTPKEKRNIDKVYQTLLLLAWHSNDADSLDVVKKGIREIADTLGFWRKHGFWHGQI